MLFFAGLMCLSSRHDRLIGVDLRLQAAKMLDYRVKSAQYRLRLPHLRYLQLPEDLAISQGEDPSHVQNLNGQGLSSHVLAFLCLDHTQDF